MEKHYRISEAARALGVCTKTIRRWDAAGVITCRRTIGNHRRIFILEIERILHGEVTENKRTVAIYGRVSSHDQKKKGLSTIAVGSWLRLDGAPACGD